MAIAKELETILDELILVGGCTIGLLITESGHPQIRTTDDVDLITEVTTLSNYYILQGKLRELGFIEGDIICRWVKNGFRVDIIPPDETILGFSNRWYDLAVKTSVKTSLPSGQQVRHVTAPLFIATKLVSFQDRGHDDFAHHDIEDIVTIINSRSELIAELQSGPPEVLEFIREEFDGMLSDNAFTDLLPGHLRPQGNVRVEVVIERMRKIAGS
jgi:predicted nucleotidyltransferase